MERCAPPRQLTVDVEERTDVVDEPADVGTMLVAWPRVDVLLLLLLVVDEVAVVVLDVEVLQAPDVVDQALLDAIEVVTC